MILSLLCSCVGIDDIDIDDDLDLDGDLNPELVEVDGYERADGTVVEPYLRTAPDDDVTNNLSFWDLVNRS